MKTAMITVMIMVLLTGGLNGEAVAQAPPVPYEEQPEVLTRGPVNEAFAQPVNLEIKTGLIAPNRPPADIEEVFPDERPAGDNFAWVPGYWAWDSDRNDYLWVSGCWRAVPPDMYWVPGYWSRPGKAGNGCPASGSPPAIPKSIICPRRLNFRTLKRRGSRRQRIGYGSRPAGTGIRVNIRGGPATGLPRRRTGYGCRPITSGRHAVMYLRTGTGTIRWSVAGCCLHRSIFRGTDMIARGFLTRWGSPSISATWASAFFPVRNTAITTSAIITTKAISASESSPGLSSSNVIPGMIRFMCTTDGAIKKMNPNGNNTNGRNMTAAEPINLSDPRGPIAKWSKGSARCRSPSEETSRWLSP